MSWYGHGRAQQRCRGAGGGRLDAGPQALGADFDKVRTTGRAHVSELVQRLSVSDVTVHRDIEAPTGRGLVTCMQGGASATGSSVDEPGQQCQPALAAVSTSPGTRPRPTVRSSTARVAWPSWRTTRSRGRDVEHLSEVDVVISNDGLESDARQALGSSCGWLVLAGSHRRSPPPPTTSSCLTTGSHRSGR